MRLMDSAWELIQEPPKGKKASNDKVEIVSEDSLQNHPGGYHSRPPSGIDLPQPIFDTVRRTDTLELSRLQIASPPPTPGRQAINSSNNNNKRPADDSPNEQHRGETPPAKNRRSVHNSPQPATGSNSRQGIPIRNAAPLGPSPMIKSASMPSGSMERFSDPQQRAAKHVRGNYSTVGIHGGPYSSSRPSEGILKQPDARPISPAQLAAEVKAIYAGLALVETKCISEVTKHAAQPKTGDRHWPAMTALHKALLHEHHDFFLASQHPSATPALRELANKYSMPARMWRHGIHNFLELLRHELPGSLDYMLSFIYLAYQMIALLYETVPSFGDTWIECLGDIARYRMAIEEDDLDDREVWTSVAKYWYSKAINRHASTGRLHHHLAILSRSHAIPQLSLYCRALSTNQPFLSAKESIKTLLDPMLKPDANFGRAPPVEIETVRCHAVLFYSEYDKFDGPFERLLSLLDRHVARVGTRFRDQGACIAISHCTAVLKYGSSSAIRTLFEEFNKDPSTALLKAQGARSTLLTTNGADVNDPDTLPVNREEMSPAWRLVLGNFTTMLKRVGDSNVVPHVLLIVFFSWTLSRAYGADYLDDSYPFDLLAEFVSAYARTEPLDSMSESCPLRAPTSGWSIVLPEDWSLRGLIWTNSIYAENFFDRATPDEDERAMERLSTGKIREQRLLWATHQFASISKEQLFVSQDVQLVDDPAEAERVLGPDSVRAKTWLAWEPQRMEFYAKTYYAVSKANALKLAADQDEAMKDGHEQFVRSEKGETMV